MNGTSLRDEMNKDMSQSGRLMSGRRCLGDKIFLNGINGTGFKGIIQGYN